MTMEERNDLKARYEALVAATAQAIDDADPTELLAIGAPQDEYSPEIRTIVPRVTTAASPAEVRRILHEEFARWFDPSIVGPEEAYEVPALRIWEGVLRFRAAWPRAEHMAALPLRRCIELIAFTVAGSPHLDRA
jgi:hypothetical protein